MRPPWSSAAVAPADGGAADGAIMGLALASAGTGGGSSTSGVMWASGIDHQGSIVGVCEELRVKRRRENAVKSRVESTAPSSVCLPRLPSDCHNHPPPSLRVSGTTHPPHSADPNIWAPATTHTMTMRRQCMHLAVLDLASSTPTNLDIVTLPLFLLASCYSPSSPRDQHTAPPGFQLLHIAHSAP